MHKFLSIALTIALLFTHESGAMLGPVASKVALGAARASHSAARIQAPMRQMVSNTAKAAINSGQIYNIIRPLTFFGWRSALITASIITLVQSKEKPQFEVRQSADAAIDHFYQNLLKSTSLDEARVLVNAVDEIILEACTNKIAEHLDTTSWYVILAIMERNADAE
ncbi:MAG TPA: hypothetical protein VJ201_07830, partial [Candidatus Babeliales bacterium]|nr:hypothetical protein [Candidatus Babeliales bacterium]